MIVCPGLPDVYALSGITGVTPSDNCSICASFGRASLRAFDDVVLDAEQPREIPPSRFVTGPSADWGSTRQSGCELASTIALNPASAPRGVQCVSCR